MIFIRQKVFSFTFEGAVYTPDFDLTILVLTRWTSKGACDSPTDPLTQISLRKWSFKIKIHHFYGQKEELHNNKMIISYGTSGS